MAVRINTCYWHLEGFTYWPSCQDEVNQGKMAWYIAGIRDFKFCPYCGKPIRIKDEQHIKV